METSSKSLVKMQDWILLNQNIAIIYCEGLSKMAFITFLTMRKNQPLFDLCSWFLCDDSFVWLLYLFRLILEFSFCIVNILIAKEIRFLVYLKHKMTTTKYEVKYFVIYILWSLIAKLGLTKVGFYQTWNNVPKQAER